MKAAAKTAGRPGRGSYKIARKKQLTFAYVLLIPFILGFFLFFLQPFVLSLVYSFNDVKLVGGGTTLVGQGLAYYKQALLVDTEFRELLISGIRDLFINVPMILIFSLFIATILNKEFYGRNMARIVLFLPVIITTGVLLSVESTDYLIGLGTQAVQGGGEAAANSTYTVDTFNLEAMLKGLQLPSQLLEYLTMILDRFYTILISSGVQITILLAALQSISPSLYEASAIEGATAWEDFWKITLPMVSPYIFVCALYTVIDTFTNPTNGLVVYIRRVAFEDQLNYGLSSAMAWVYFGIIAVVLGLVAALFLGTKFVVYQDK